MAIPVLRHRTFAVIACTAFIGVSGAIEAAAQASVPTKDANSLSIAIRNATITAVAAGVGWIVAQVVARRREDRTKRLQIALDRADAQIREFYAPMVALTAQMNTMVWVNNGATEGRPGDRAVDAYMWKQRFLPLHEEVVALVKTKSHLREPDDSDDFDAYFWHFAAQVVYWDFVEKDIPLKDMGWPNYPELFFVTLRQHHDAVQARYNASLEELRHTMTPKPVKVMYRQAKDWITRTNQDDPSRPHGGSIPAVSSTSLPADRPSAPQTPPA